MKWLRRRGLLLEECEAEGKGDGLAVLAASPKEMLFDRPLHVVLDSFTLYAGWRARRARLDPWGAREGNDPGLPDTLLRELRAYRWGKVTTAAFAPSCPQGVPWMQQARGICRQSL